jgi:hypothetical protein
VSVAVKVAVVVLDKRLQLSVAMNVNVLVHGHDPSKSARVVTGPAPPSTVHVKSLQSWACAPPRVEIKVAIAVSKSSQVAVASTATSVMIGGRVSSTRNETGFSTWLPHSSVHRQVMFLKKTA